MTILGFIALVGFATSLVKGRAGLVFVIAASAPFNDSVMFNFGSVSLPPYYFGLMLLLLTTALGRRHSGIANQTIGTRYAYLLALFIYACVATVVMPRLLAGLPIISSNLSIDDQYNNLQPLAFSASNVAQLAYLGLNLAFLLVNHLDRLVRWVHLMVAFAVGSMVAALVNAIGGPPDGPVRSFFDNGNRRYYGVTNVLARGQFSEPSHLGAFSLTALFFAGASLVFMRREPRSLRWTMIALVLVDVALLAVSASGTAVAGLALASLLLGGGLLVRLARGGTISGNSAIVLLLGALGLVWLGPNIYGAAANFVDHKQSQFSYVHRGFADKTALAVLRASDYIGVGLGSNRASSLLLMLLSTVGIVGTALFFMATARAMRIGTASGQLPAVVGLVAFLSSAAISLADLASPVMWLLFAVCYGCRSQGSAAELDAETMAIGCHVRPSPEPRCSTPPSRVG